MSESLFQISCPSCESVFAVTDPELVGQIIACPKCGGMMLVEAAEVERSAGNSEDASFGEAGENEADGEDFAGVPKAPVVDEARSEETGDADANGEEEEKSKNSENGKNEEDGVGEGGAAFERSRNGGKFVASGIAFLLVGALAFFGLRGFNGESTSIDEPNAEVAVGEDGGDGEDGESLARKLLDDVGGFAPVAREERTSVDEATGRQNEPTLFEIGGTEENAGIGEVGEKEENREDAGIGEDAREFAAADAGKESAGVAEDAQVGGNGEVEGTGNLGEDGENAASETIVDEGNAPSDDEGLDGLGDLASVGDLSDLGEDVTLDGEENEGAPALEENESVKESELAGSNSATGFNEADFERANRSDDSENDAESAEIDWSGVASTTSPTLQGALPTLRRERKEIDLEARLALPIKSIEFPSSPVAAVRLLSEFAGVSILPELETFVLTRPSTNVTLDLTLHDVTVGEALDKVAALLNWEVCKEGERILLRPVGYSSEDYVEERFDVADLTLPCADENDETRLEMFELPNNLTPEAVAALIKSTVAPESWDENGGRGTLTIDGSTLTICQNAQNREKARALLEGLRAIRGLEPRENAAPERIIPEKLGWEKLTKKMTFAPLSPLTLQNAVEILEKSQKFQVFWDDAALIEAGVGRDATTAVKVENGTLDAILSEILEPLKATYLILGENLILITAENAAESYQTVEFFSLVGPSDVAPTLAEARELIEEWKRLGAPESWEENDVSTSEVAEVAEVTEVAEVAEVAEETSTDEFAKNGENGENGEVGEVAAINHNDVSASFSEQKEAIWLDVESSCLIIRQTQPNQRALRRWLTARLTAFSEGKEANPK